jgi:hypothetical protein
MPKTIKDTMYSFNHSVQRFKERYDKDLTLKQYNLWNDSIKNVCNDNKSNENIKIISKTKVNNNNTSYTVQLIKENIYMVFETERNTITTFLPRSSFEK